MAVSEIVPPIASTAAFATIWVAVRCSSLILSSLMAFVFTFPVCHVRDLAWELVNGDDGGGPPVGLYGKVASKTKDSVAHVPFIYLHGHIYYKL